MKLLTQHIRAYLDLYGVLLSWSLVGAFLPTIAGVVFAILTYMLLMRTADFTKMFIGLVTILVLSDSRVAMFAFAETAKIGVVVLLLVYVLFNYKDFRENKNEVFSYFLPFIGFSVLASIWSDNVFIAFQKSVSYGSMIFLVPLFLQASNRQNPRFGAELISFFTVLLALGLAIHFFNPTFTTLAERYRGLLGNPNGLGIFLTVVFAVYYPYRRRFEGTEFGQWGFNGLFIFVFVASLLLTGSRTSLFAFVIFIIFNRLRMFSNLFTVIVFAALVLSYEYLLSRLPEFIEFVGLAEYFRLDTLEEGSGRFVAWNFAWTRIQDVYFAGGGFGHTESVFSKAFAELSLLGHLLSYAQLRL